MLTEGDWKRHLRRRDLFRLADNDTRNNNIRLEDRLYKFFLQADVIDYDNLDLNRFKGRQFFLNRRFLTVADP